MKKLLIWGAGDQGTVTLECALATQQYSQIDFLKIKEKGHRDIPHYRVYSEDEVEFTTFLKSYDEVFVATGNNDIRENKITMLKTMDITIGTLIHPRALISPTAKVLAGTIVLANAVVNTNATVGMGCIINTATIIEHDCIIEDFVNISPNTAIAGHTKIGQKTFIGVGTAIIDDIVVGKEVIIGAGSSVISNIPEYTTVVGVPAKVIKVHKNHK